MTQYDHRMAGLPGRERHPLTVSGPERCEHRIETWLDGEFRPTSELRYRRVG